MRRGNYSVKEAITQVAIRGTVRSSRQTRPPLGKRGFLAAAITLALPLAMAPAAPVLAQAENGSQAPAVAQSQQAYRFDIPAKPLPQAIADLSAVTGLQVLYTEQSTFDHTAPALQGSYTVRDALQRLLAGSGLVMRFTGEHSVTVELAGQDGLMTLPPVKVVADNLGSLYGIAESTNSYTTGNMSTATKLNLSPRETPQTSLVFTRKNLDDRHINSGHELLAKIPGVSLDRTDERLAPSARGFSVDFYLFDGHPTYSMNGAAVDPDLLLYDRVEVVKGANGLVTGAGNPAMGINYIRKHANSKEFLASVDLGAGSWDRYRMEAEVQTPLNSDGSIRARFIAKREDERSFLDFLKKQKDILYGVVDVDLTDTSHLSLGVSYEDYQRDGIRWGGLPAFYTDGSRVDFSRSKNFSDDWTKWDNEILTLYADLSQNIYDDISLNLSYIHKEIDTNNNMAFFLGKVDKSNNNAVGNYMTWESNNKAKEDGLDVYFSVPFEVADLEQEVVFGVSYSSSRVREEVAEGWFDASGINFDRVSIPVPAHPAFDKYPPNETIQKAYYMAGKLVLREGVKFVVGARVSSWEHKVDGRDGDRKFEDEITPYAGLIYDIDRRHSAYISYTSIFQPTGNVDEQDNYLDPAVGKSWEAGFKGEYFDGGLNAYLSIFRIEKTGFEAIGIKTPKGKDASKRIDGVVSEGFELGASGNITDNLSLDFGIANFEARNPDGTKFETKNSRTTANLWAKYAIGDFNLGAGVNYKSKFYTKGVTVNTVIKQDAYVTTDLMVAYKATKNLDFQVNIHNLFDKKYYEGIGDFLMNYGEPRSFVFNAKYSY